MSSRYTSLKTAIVVPWRPDGGRRDLLWKFTQSWLRTHHPNWEIFIGESDPGPFNRGQAVNRAVSLAGDFDVIVIHDADNIADKGALNRAVLRSYAISGCVFPYDTYLYLDSYTSDRLILEDNWFIAPIRSNWGVAREHCSGVQAISRTAYDQVGGFPELEGWGSEDYVMLWMLKAFTGGVEYLPGSAYHLHHNKSVDADKQIAALAKINRRICADVMALSVVPEQLRQYLQDGGHPIP